MKLRSKIILALTAVAVALLGRSSGPRRELETARRALRREGFKIDLNEFALLPPPDIRRRAAVLAPTTRAEVTNRNLARPNLSLRLAPRFITPIGSNAALVVWKLDEANAFKPYLPAGDFWTEAHESQRTNQVALAAMQQAASGGEIRFEPIGHPNPQPLLPYLANLKTLTTAFGMQTFLALHDEQKEEAWTNLLATTCLATAYTPEPIDISHLVHMACAVIAGDVTWNALLAHVWTEGQLAELQRRWEGVDFLGGLPETAAYSRANMAATCQLYRRQGPEFGEMFRQLFRSPKTAWAELAGYWRRNGYRWRGSFEDERALLLYYRDRELELRQAVRARTWLEMRQFPGVTNTSPFRSTNFSPAVAMMNVRQLMVAIQGSGGTFLGRAAEAEARRRLVITAIALERYRGRHGTYPNALADLVPEFLTSVPQDFMDGEPLRYRPTGDGYFELYSVGLDCVDNGGLLRGARAAQRFPQERPDSAGGWAYQPPTDFSSERGLDLVWPRPASAAEIEAYHQEQKQLWKEWERRVSEQSAEPQSGRSETLGEP